LTGKAIHHGINGIGLKRLDFEFQLHQHAPAKRTLQRNALNQCKKSLGPKPTPLAFLQPLVFTNHKPLATNHCRVQKGLLALGSALTSADPSKAGYLATADSGV
jgi:hypothetical protein